MDETKRPIQIPPEFYMYAEKHGLFELYKDMIQELLIERPENPILFMIEYLNRESTDLPSVLVLGPPASGKKTIARLAANKLRAVYLNEQTLIEESDAALKNNALACRRKGKEIPVQLWKVIVKERLSQTDVTKRGYVISGFPRTREQALALQTAGISPQHCVLLQAPDTVLIERAAGKRIDPTNDDVYHTTFDWPSNPEIQNRLVEIPGYTEDYIAARLKKYHREIDGTIECYQPALKSINSDQPKPDIFAQVFSFLSTYPRSATPFTPRILLLGATGSGRAVQGALLANKYDLVNVSSGQLIKEALVSDSKIGRTIKAYMDKEMPAPDMIVLELVRNRLSKVDCVTKGWVLHGYPLNTEQADHLHISALDPNRVFFLDVPNDSIIERLTLRMTDPATGERYHLLYNPPRVPEIRERLQRHPKDEEDEVRRRLKRYHAYREDLDDYYQSAQHVNADQDPHTVFEIIESHMVNQLPKRYK